MLLPKFSVILSPSSILFLLASLFFFFLHSFGSFEALNAFGAFNTINTFNTFGDFNASFAPYTFALLTFFKSDS